MQPKAHSWIEGLAPYKAGKAKVDGVENPVKLSANESTYGPSPKALEAYQKEAVSLHRYPDPASSELSYAIARVHNLDARRILCGAGSDEILTLLIHSFAGPEDEIIHSQYGFAVYPIQAQAVGARSIAVPNKDWAADVDGILAAVTARTKLVFIDNPNNPTGAYVPWAEIKRLHAGLPAHVILVLDAAYGECADAEDYQAGEALVEAFDNVIMTRTFSKLYALAALRVGWAYGSEAILDPLHRVRMPFNVNTAAQAAALAAVDDQEHLKKAVFYNKKWREILTAELVAMGLNVVPSQTNFLLVEFPEGTAENVYEYLMKNGYILRYLPGQGLPNHIRLTIGSEQENNSVIALIKECMNGSGYE
ncbi:histidinol-phosphate transaminase [Temperatibacter marinus]|uniref:Histidinol-phosphate aminotransferase n=2 Tax=Temperatibacter marinus TaxID=1456591 RepID=A0AA52EK86_9PROT|nr:histidinol-phosphate transaminase [Temperatibacter marinus]WND04024.1 histidinol-phosphate transaminase [Temperatibacter marinus]